MITKIVDNNILCPSNVRVEAESEDIYLNRSCYGLILIVPDGSYFRVKADTTLTIDPVVCP